MAKTTEITLGDLTFTAHKMNLGESEEAAEYQEILASGSLKQKIAAARAIVTIAVRRDAPETTDAQMKAVEAGPMELFAAVDEYMGLNGYKKEAAKGEGQAVEGAAA